MSKERLEEIEKNLDPLGYGMGGHLISVNDIYWLVKYAKEQSERVQELEEQYYNLKESVYKTQMDFLDANKYRNIYKEQNKLYREALEEISQKRMTYADMAGVLLIARKALEESE